MDEKFIEIAIKEAKKAESIGEIPVGAVIVKDNIVLSKAHNLKEKNNCVTKHAELVAIEKASKKINSWRLDDCVLYTTLFPCPMCASAIQQSRIKKIVYICDSNSKYIKTNSNNILINYNSNHIVEILKFNFETNLVKTFFKKIRKK